MSASTQCPHPDWDFNIEIFDFVGEGDTLRRMVLEGKCKSCGNRMLFRGAPGTSWSHATVAIDGSNLDAPFSVEGDPVDESRSRPGFTVSIVGGQ
jgi:hypothetical protein